MDLSYRPMRASDIAPCVALVRADPIVGPRYSPVIELLPAVWARLLGQESFQAVVFCTSDRKGTRIIGARFSTFVTDDFMRRLKTAPMVWIGPELVQRVSQGRSPLLSDQEVAKANSICDGLNMVVLAGTLDRTHLPKLLDVYNKGYVSVLERSSGFCVKEFITQAESEEHLQAVLNTGHLLLCDQEKRYVEPRADQIRNLLHEPHIIGITRDLAPQRLGAWVNQMFQYKQPYLHLNRGQQRLLMAAMNGATDIELAAQLNMSGAAVKKRWRDIYDRVHDRVPELFSAEESPESSSKRGKAKKHRLLSYVREHPEELRPIIRKAARRIA